MIRILFSLILFGITLSGTYAGDTIRVMHYNLMYYDNYTSVSACNATTNNVDLKDGYLAQITGHYKPDIFTVNELNEAVTSAQRLLSNALNVNGISHYRRANFMGNTYSNSGNIISMLYYNSNKLALKSQTYISANPRNVMVYRLFYKPSLTSNPSDTIYLTCFVLHPKAGDTVADMERRTETANLIMNYIASNSITGNVMLMGDLNVYTSTEGSFVKFTSPTNSGFRFFDPINAIGYWNNNSAFANVHTQSTRTTGTCFATGGMDDRFDFILTSQQLLSDNNRLRYVKGSYWAFGQDGNRFNSSLISPANNSLPSNIIMSLYNMSDHLPVTLKLFVNTNTSDLINDNNSCLNFSFSNPASENLKIVYSTATLIPILFEVYDIMGGLVYKTLVQPTGHNDEATIPVNNLNSGLYLLRVSQNGANTVTRKFIKN